MKKLLCVLMFGMMFGQDAISTREFEIPYNSNIMEVDISEYTSLGEGVYEIHLVAIIIDDIDIDVDDSEICRWQQFWNGVNYNNYDSQLGKAFTITLEKIWSDPIFITTNIGFMQDRHGETSALVTQDNPVLNSGIIYGVMSEEGCVNSLSGSWLIRVSGRFDDTDVGLQGDMNDDDSLDVIDVVMLVDVILNGGVGDVGDLLNVVTG